MAFGQFTGYPPALMNLLGGMTPPPRTMLPADDRATVGMGMGSGMGTKSTAPFTGNPNQMRGGPVSRGAPIAGDLPPGVSPSPWNPGGWVQPNPFGGSPSMQMFQQYMQNASRQTPGGHFGFRPQQMPSYARPSRESIMGMIPGMNPYLGRILQQAMQQNPRLMPEPSSGNEY